MPLSLPSRSACALAYTVSCCLVLWNLGHAPLWYDEAPTALVARVLLSEGDILGFDGLNLFGGTNGRTLNRDMRDVLPPAQYALTAASFALLGEGAWQARLPHALCGLGALAALFFLLRRVFPPQQEGAFVAAYVLVCLSPQLLLYFRQSRYFGLMALTCVLTSLAWERWRERGGWRPGAVLSAVLLTAFLNHYVAAFALGLSLAAWSLFPWPSRALLQRDLGRLLGGGLPAALAALAYLAWLGVLGRGRLRPPGLYRRRPAAGRVGDTRAGLAASFVDLPARRLVVGLGVVALPCLASGRRVARLRAAGAAPVFGGRGIPAVLRLAVAAADFPSGDARRPEVRRGWSAAPAVAAQGSVLRLAVGLAAAGRGRGLRRLSPGQLRVVAFRAAARPRAGRRGGLHLLGLAREVAGGPYREAVGETARALLEEGARAGRRSTCRRSPFGRR